MQSIFSYSLLKQLLLKNIIRDYLESCDKNFEKENENLIISYNTILFILSF